MAFDAPDDPARHARLAEHFAHLLSLEAPARESYLQQHPPALRDELRSLLRFHETQAAVSLAAGGMERWIAEGPAVLPAGTRVGSFVIESLLGRGGASAVYAARQVGAIEREVALKVLDVPDAIASPGRFAAERQALAMLRHPSIAHLYDADVDADGRAYIAMERVPGIPADAWREQVRPDARQSVELILQLADALEYAHGRGVIHRDIKPSNVLVEPQSGRVRLIDFGLVTAVGASALRRWLNPRESDVGGTPYFMAPEQASIEPVPHDVRVDVYGAGALLYFLLSGRAPIDLEDCRSAPAPVVLEAVRARPRRPVREVAPGVDRDLAAVVDRALLPDDRYPNIAALTGDLRRWRAGRPVQARRAGWANASIKFIRRNKAPVAAITMMLLLLVGGLVGTAIGLRRAQAENQRFREMIALNSTMNRFFTEDLLGGATANRQGRDLRVADLLDRAVERLPGALDDAPLVEASLRYVLGRTFMQLGDIARADTIAAPALALVESHAHPQDPITARVINLIGQIRILQNKPDAAEALFQRTLTTPAVGIESDWFEAAARVGMAMVLDARGRSADAIPLVDEALRLIALGKTRDGYDPQALGNRLQEAEALNLRVVLLNSAGLKQEADVAAAALPEQLAALLGRDHFYTAAAAATRAQVLLDLQRPNEALPLLESAVPVFERELGPEHRDTLVVLGNQISALGGSGRIAQAAGQAETLLARTEKVLGSRHFDTLLMRHRVAVMHYKARQPDRALPFATSAVEGMLALAGERNWLAGQFFVTRALIQNQRHEIDAALADVRRGLLIYDRTPPPDPSRVETARRLLQTLEARSATRPSTTQPATGG